MREVPGTVSGLLIVDKPAGWTSHDVVGKVRRLAGTRRVGHAGTLDPMATGVLVVLVGRATRAAEFAEAQVKGYRAHIRFGVTTDTLDTEATCSAAAEAYRSRTRSAPYCRASPAKLSRYRPCTAR